MIFFGKSKIVRKRVWSLLEPAEDDDKLSKFTDIFLVSLIFFNILMVILETVENLYVKYMNYFLDTLSFFRNYFLWNILEGMVLR